MESRSSAISQSHPATLEDLRHAISQVSQSREQLRRTFHLRTHLNFKATLQQFLEDCTRIARTYSVISHERQFGYDWRGPENDAQFSGAYHFGEAVAEQVLQGLTEKEAAFHRQTPSGIGLDRSFLSAETRITFHPPAIAPMEGTLLNSSVNTNAMQHNIQPSAIRRNMASSVPVYGMGPPVEYSQTLQERPRASFLATNHNMPAPAGSPLPPGSVLPLPLPNSLYRPHDRSSDTHERNAHDRPGTDDGQ